MSPGTHCDKIRDRILFILTKRLFSRLKAEHRKKITGQDPVCRLTQRYLYLRKIFKNLCFRRLHHNKYSKTFLSKVGFLNYSILKFDLKFSKVLKFLEKIFNNSSFQRLCLKFLKVLKNF